MSQVAAGPTSNEARWALEELELQARRLVRRSPRWKREPERALRELLQTVHATEDLRASRGRTAGGMPAPHGR